MPLVRPAFKRNTLIACLATLVITPAAHGAISDLNTWDFYRDPNPGAGPLTDAMTGSIDSNVAKLAFVGGVPIPDGFDIGYASVNANTVGEATSGYYFDPTEDFTVAMHFSLNLTNLNGLVGLGFGIGEDRAGVNAAGIGFVAGTDGGSESILAYTAAATTNDNPLNQFINLIVLPNNQFFGSLTVAYKASSGDVTVGVSQFLGAPTPLAPTSSYTIDGDGLPNWAGDEGLLVSFFLRSDTLESPEIGSWNGESAEAEFFDFTVVQGNAIPVPEPTSLALIALGLGMVTRRRR